MLFKQPIIRKEDILILIDKNFNLRNVGIVTGAANGIGRATSIAMAANNLNCVGLDINEKELKKTGRIIQEMGGQFTYVKTDLSKDKDIVNAVKEAAKLGTIKYLANIAGFQHLDSVEDFPIEKYDLMQRTMLRAPFYLAKLTIPYMKKSSNGEGVVGNMASIHAHICSINKSVYNITKFGLRGLTQSIAAEGNGKIRSFSVSTGFVKTNLTFKQISRQSKQRRIKAEQVVEDVMMGKSRIKTFMAPIEVANLFIFGFSGYSRYLIGGDLLFDGGVVLTY
jgi:3-hydroxybutyrate dehydrogenase